MAALHLSLSDISLSFGGEALFTSTDLAVAPGARIALVGRNGSGKSTLLKIAAGMIEPDSGERFLQPGILVRYLAQEPDFSRHSTAEEFIVAGLNVDRDRHQAPALMEELNIPAGASLATMSGGELRRVAIAQLLIADPDVLLLDEPTNHLDLPTIEWLEHRLAKMKAAMVIISHDRRFLENITTQTVWIDRGAAKKLHQGFRAFENWRDKQLEEEEAAHHKLGRKIVAEEHWMRYGVTARRKRNMRRVGELQELRKTLREARRPQGTVKFSAPDIEKSGKRVIVADKISKSFGARKIVDRFSIEIARGERIGLAGPNGAGKTTLLNMLTGQLAPDEGSIHLGANLNIINLDQRRESLKPDMRLADAITDGRGDWVTIAGAKRHASSYLQDFLFTPEQWRSPVHSLSGGERGRLALAAALAKPSNLLVLDEPTNDLDLETLDLLEDLLSNYEGTLLLVSHDRSFLDRIVTSVITTDPDKPAVWRCYPGGYDDMIAQRGSAPGSRSRNSTSVKIKPPTKKQSPQGATQKTKLSYKEKYALETLPGKIAELEASIENLKTQIADPALFESDAALFNRCAQELDAAQAALDSAEDEWLTLELKRETLSQ